MTWSDGLVPASLAYSQIWTEMCRLLKSFPRRNLSLETDMEPGRVTKMPKDLIYAFISSPGKAGEAHKNSATLGSYTNQKPRTHLSCGHPDSDLT
jgi:hypothetical protein